jgi:hypothetical protein
MRSRAALRTPFRRGPCPEVRAIIIAAGALAELCYEGSGDYSVLSDAWGYDTDDADWTRFERCVEEAAASDHSPGHEVHKEESMRRHCLETARRIVSANWPAVEQLAHALHERGELSGDEVRALVDSD